MLVVCICMYLYVPYVTRMLLVCYPYVLVWCFSHDPLDHGEPENDGFHKQNFDYLRFQVYQTINTAKVNVSMSDINV